ncbi:hypothetical protein ES703_101031 [subsurface metagenome]
MVLAKLKNPLLSLGARGALTRALTFVRRRKQHLVEETPTIIDVKSPAQLSWRHMYQKCAALWQTLDAIEKREWEALGSIRHMTGFACWQSQCLKPNPGIYLPLQGGTMQGAIQMDGHHIHGLPLPVHVQDVWRRKDYQDFTLPYLHDEGARVYHSADQQTVTGVGLILAFNSEKYDDYNMHHLTVNNSRLTCVKAGVYFIGAQVVWASHAVGNRQARILLNGATL